MASRTLEALFLAAREHLARADRFQNRTVLFLAVLQLAVLLPFSEGDRQRSNLATEIRTLESVSGELIPLGERLESSRVNARQQATPALDTLVDNLRRDLAELDAALELARSTPPGIDKPAPPEEEEGEEPSDDPADKNPWLAYLEDPTILEAQNRYSLLTALEPVVDQHLVAPRFDPLNQLLAEQLRPNLQAEIDSVAGEISTLRSRWDRPTATWGEVASSLGALRRTVDDLEFNPPQHAYWWASPEDEPGLELRLGEAVATELRQPLAFDQLDTLAAQALDRLAQLVKELNLAAVERQEYLATLGSEGRAPLGLPIADILNTWPFLLGLLLALVVSFRSLRLRQLGLLTTLHVDHGAPDALRGWLLAELRGGTDPEPTTASTTRTCFLRTFLLLLLGWAWIAAAAWPNLGGGPPALTEALPALAGAAALLLAVLYRLHLVGQLIDQCRVRQGTPLPLPEEISQEALEGQDLLR